MFRGFFAQGQHDIAPPQFVFIRVGMAETQAIPSKLPDGSRSITRHIESALRAGGAETFNQHLLDFEARVWRLGLHADGILNFGDCAMKRAGFLKTKLSICSAR